MRQRARRAIVIPATLALAATLAATTGCNNPVHALRVNATPELASLADTHDEAANKLWTTHNMDLRALSEDAARAFHLDRPTRLSPAPIPR